MRLRQTRRRLDDQPSERIRPGGVEAQSDRDRVSASLQKLRHRKKKPSVMRLSHLHPLLVSALFSFTLAISSVRAADSFDAYNGLARANGKQIARVGKQWLVVTPDPSGRQAWLATSGQIDSTPLRDWARIRFLSADASGLFASKGPCATPPSLVSDGSGDVQAMWGDGESVWYARVKANAAGGPGQRSAWTGADGKEPKPILVGAMPGDIASTDQGQVWIAAVKHGANGASTLCVAHYAGQWELEDLAEGIGFHPPVLHLLADGSAHIAWSDTRGRILYLHYRPGEKAEPTVVCPGGFSNNGRNPTIIDTGRQLLIAYESLYDQIEFAVEENGQWRNNQRLTSLDPRLTTDVLHSPQLALDRHGVAWLLFSDTTRKFTYFTRWLGSQWSDIYDGRGIYYRSPRFESDLLPADWFGVEKYPPTNATEIGIALANGLAEEKREFHRLLTPAPAAGAGSSTLFFDLLETAATDNLDLVLNEARKDDHNPLVKPGEAGLFDQDRVLNHGTVLFDGDRFRMWYGAAHRQPGGYWWTWMGTGYAESRDGLHWEKPRLNVSEPGKHLDANQLPLPWPCAVFKDIHDANPEQRYKVVQFDRHQLQLMAALAGHYDMDGPTCPGGLYQSPDGVHWAYQPISVTFPDGKPWELVVQSFFIDQNEPDPQRRWKIYGYATLVARRRAGCFAYSADGKVWTAYPRNPILDPTVSESPMAPAGPESQIHDTVVFPYHGYYLALFHAQHDARFLDVELAASRDGEHFTHIKHGHKVIPLGPAGSWDSQQILQTPAVAAQDKLWLFYGGLSLPPELLAKGITNNEMLAGAAGVSTLRLDGFTHLALKPEKSAGSMTTVPFEVPDGHPLRLLINATCAADARIAVEILDAASSEPLPGFSRKDCQACQEDNIRAAVRWTGGDVLRLAHGKPIVIRFWFSGSTSPKLFGFTFVAAE